MSSLSLSLIKNSKKEKISLLTTITVSYFKDKTYHFVGCNDCRILQFLEYFFFKSPNPRNSENLANHTFKVATPLFLHPNRNHHLTKMCFKVSFWENADFGKGIIILKTKKRYTYIFKTKCFVFLCVLSGVEGTIGCLLH